MDRSKERRLFAPLLSGLHARRDITVRLHQASGRELSQSGLLYCQQWVAFVVQTTRGSEGLMWCAFNMSLDRCQTTQAPKYRGLGSGPERSRRIFPRGTLAGLTQEPSIIRYLKLGSWYVPSRVTSQFPSAGDNWVPLKLTLH